MPQSPKTFYQSLLFIVRVIFIGAIVFSLAGSLFLRLFPSTLEFFGPYYENLVKAPTWTYMALLGVAALLMYGPTVGWKRIAVAAFWGMFIGGMSELIGTTTGYPYGEYLYTGWLGPKIFGHVPYFIPISWFALSIVCYDLAGRVYSGQWGRILIATSFMVLWDVTLDPAMSKAFPFWVYPQGGFYYGMPLSNWAGWAIVSFIIMVGYSILFRNHRVFHKWSFRFYIWNCVFPILLCLLYGLYGAFALGVTAMLIPVALVLNQKKIAPKTPVPAAY